jgi:hypothetical protein
MLLKQSCPQAGKADSPGMAVPTVVVDNDELEIIEDDVLETDVEMGLDDDSELEILVVITEELEILVVGSVELEMEDDSVVIRLEDDVDKLATVVVKPSKAFAQTIVPSSPAVAATTV